MRRATIIAGNGRRIAVLVTDQAHGGFYAEPEAAHVYGVAYFLGRGRMAVERQRWGTGRNAGMFLSSTLMPGARWEWAS